MRKATMGLILLVLATLLAACGGLAGEPEIVGQVPIQQQQSAQNVEVVAPDIEPNLLLGERIFAENCVRCHGMSGAGDGEFALSGQVKDVPDFTDPAQHEGKSANDYYRQVTLGNLEKLMPPFGDSLSEEERWSVANFIFTLVDAPVSVASEGHAGLDIPDTSEDVTEETTTEETTEETVEVVTGTISGNVTLATEGATLPEGLMATLFIFDMEMNEETFETTVNADGTYQFDNVAIDDQHGYFVSVEYNDGSFNSDFLRGTIDTNTMTLDVTLYDTTDDTSVLHLASVLTQVDLIDDNTVRIWQAYSWVNTSDKLFTTGSATGHPLSVRVPVPNGATLTEDNDMSRYMYDSESGYVYDSYPLLPATEHSFYLQYTAPFSGNLELNQLFDYELVGIYQVYADEATFDLVADGWDATQTQEFNGVVYNGLSTSGSAESLAITIKSKGFSFNLDKQSMGMVLTVFGIVFIAVAVFLFVKGGKPSEPSDTENRVQSLMKEIADLDDSFHAEEISEAQYKKERAALKAQLTRLMKTES